MLILDDLTFAYLGAGLSYRFAMTAEPGEITAIRGASGSGKSTLLDLVAGFLAPASGTIRIDAIDLTPLPPERRPVSILFQSETLFEHLSAARNIALGLPSARPDDPRITAALAEVGLPGIGAQRAATLSGGQKQRVALARALATEPKVVLFDEPLGSLDANLRKAMQVELKRMHRELGRTFIYVTHDQDEALTMSDRIAVMQNAKLLQVGTPEEIYLRPNSAAVARFIGAANILGGEVESAGEDGALIRLRDGSTVRTAAGDCAAAVGKPVQLMMRAEHFVFARSRPEANLSWLRGRVVERLFLGRSVEYQVTLGRSEELLTLLDQGREVPTVERGGMLEFGIAPAHVRLLME